MHDDIKLEYQSVLHGYIPVINGEPLTVAILVWRYNFIQEEIENLRKKFGALNYSSITYGINNSFVLSSVESIQQFNDYLLGILIADKILNKF